MNVHDRFIFVHPKGQERSSRDAVTLWNEYRKTTLLVPGVDQFSNADIFVLDQLIVEIRIYFKTST